MDLNRATISALFPFGRFIGLDEHARNAQTDIRKLKSAPLSRGRHEQRVQAEESDKASTVIGLPGSSHAVPVVGKRPAVRADHQVTNVVRAPDIRGGQRVEPPQIAPQLPRVNKRMDGRHGVIVWQALFRVKHARVPDEFCKTSRVAAANGDA